ncbi:Hsp70 family protein [Burkholderia oklahomensis]|uniref:Hsp70 family protein n=1 Tax=Burkholderia oklahomensis TaxID=342113 RepID=UPI00016A7C87|nr:Hsp70 family protein [Burkholderia oklahomensis]AJX35806.1 DNA-K related family protein [Burkholderia oklahomensis C6786]AOI49032.1 molecular chaperone DnaK [Burkholderia oklahomensis C6786]KUY61063.1 molecular chaperone DnaK [Burkholderia oklahomensis C6786]MBI0362744.1 hsp70 family protein [Burkholderia oklahomensis]SUY26853.1 Heat shock protein 70 [Burkholderia oklahomensis]
MKPFIVGIDLGTSNTVVAYVETGGDAIRVFDVDQLVAPGEVGARPLLPSARYHPAPGEFAPGDLRLPWRDAEGSNAGDAPPAVIGTLARSLGAQVPGRLVASAKSWLSHASVDRLAPILPWGAADADGKVSPVAASASYLAHVRAAWNSRFPDARLEDQDVVLTVPASFDDGARALTLEAARIAQLPALRLLEEPQAAFYDWLFHHRATLRESLAQTRLVLVCDVGGGTTDLTLIKVHVEDGEPQLTRIGVGDHLMLGGDNMDLALARLAETRLTQDDARLSAASLSQLVERCRTAKERLLDAAPPDTVGVTLLGAGARLVGGARKTELSREEVERIVVDGFFPAGGPDDLPRKSRAALVEFGLPYAADPAVTRHIAAFLHRLAAQSRDALGAPEAAGPALPIPDTLLLNGGVFRSKVLADRLAGVLGDWRRQPLHVLHNDHPDVAVARGAVAYGLARAGQAPRIGGGSPRSYFLVVDDDAGASRGVCVLPRGTAEGHEVHLDDRVFALRLGHPVRFHLASTVADDAWRPGELADLAAGDFVRLPPVATVVQQQDAGGSRERLVKLTTSLTEVGTLDMHCIATDDPSQRWLLEFQLRRERAEDGAADAPRHPSLDKAIELVDRSFGARLANVDPKEVRRLRAQLEQLLGPRENWDIALLRELFGALWERVGRRRRSADHERVWLNLAGYCVRPGFGYPLDDWRVAQLWTLFDDGIQYVNEGQVWSEWWTLWRRAAGGLDEDAQLQALDAMAWLQEAAGAKRPKLPFDPAKIGDMDMVRVAASLERVAVDRKIELGERLLARLRRPAENHQCWWAIGRIGARRPLYGSAHGVVPPDVASRWLDAILAVDWKKVEPAAFAAVQIARMTGDRSNDLALDVRDKVVRRLASVNAPAAWSQMVREVVTLDNADTGRAFGESLPAGLKLVAG